MTLSTTTNSKHTSSRVAIIRCDTYDKDQVNAAVERGLTLIGGVSQYVRPDEKIVLKPNLLVGSAPEKAVTTHPAVMQAVAQTLQQAGANLSYGDSPGFQIRPDGAAKRSGLAQVAQDLDIPLAEFIKGQTVSFPNGNLIKKFFLAQGVIDADGIVSLPKLKTHGLTRITGAIKNQFGCIPGMLKGEFHTRLPDVELFSRMLVDLNRLIQPRLFVMDGILAMEGNGPNGGTPRSMSVLLFSSDPVAMDATVCHLVDLDPHLVPFINWGEKLGLGNIQDIEFVGDPIQDLVQPDFDVNRRPGSTTTAPGFLNRILKDRIVPRPVLNPNQCTHCGTCVQVCPATPKAIAFGSNGRQSAPSYNYRACIRCYCCQEMCPEHAIDIETPLLGRLIHRKV